MYWKKPELDFNILKILCKNKITDLKINCLLYVKFGFLICKFGFSTMPRNPEYLHLTIKTVCPRVIWEAHTISFSLFFSKLIIKTFT